MQLVHTQKQAYWAIDGIMEDIIDEFTINLCSCYSNDEDEGMHSESDESPGLAYPL
jgi:hypothetical protein